MNHLFLGLTVFLACCVEMVEALTIVLAIGIARQWRSALQGAASAIVLLGLILLIFGPLIERIPRRTLWFIIGSLLLFFGVQWLRNAILRYSGVKAIHDESAVFQKVSKEARKKSKRFEVLDWYGFTAVFKGVFLEGLEVVFIVLSLSSNQGGLRLGILAAVAAFVVVCLVGVIVHKPLSKIPENTFKFIVGLILTTFGTYFAGRGLGITWPGGELAFAHILVFYAFVCTGLTLLFVERNERLQSAK